MSEEFFEKAIDWTKKHGFSNIKANSEEYEKPSPFIKPGEETPYIPDITGLKTGGKSYIEIAMKTENMERKVSKWKLLSTLAARKGGTLFLLAPRGHKRFAEDIVRDHHLNAVISTI